MVNCLSDLLQTHIEVELLLLKVTALLIVELHLRVKREGEGEEEGGGGKGGRGGVGGRGGGGRRGEGGEEIEQMRYVGGETMRKRRGRHEER